MTLTGVGSNINRTESPVTEEQHVHVHHHETGLTHHLHIVVSHKHHITYLQCVYYSDSLEHNMYHKLVTLLQV